MGRPLYEISAEDYEAAEGWIGRHLRELPPEAAQALRGASSPANLQSIVERFFNPAQRRRLHTSIRQTRHRARQESICVTLNGETAAQLYQLDEWWESDTRKFYQLLNKAKPEKKSINHLLKRLIFERWNEAFWARIRVLERKEGRKFSYDEAKALALKAGQKLDK